MGSNFFPTPGPWGWSVQPNATCTLIKILPAAKPLFPCAYIREGKEKKKNSRKISNCKPGSSRRSRHTRGSVLPLAALLRFLRAERRWRGGRAGRAGSIRSPEQRQRSHIEAGGGWGRSGRRAAARGPSPAASAASRPFGAQWSPGGARRAALPSSPLSALGLGLPPENK